MGLDQYVYRIKQVGQKTIKELDGKHTDDIDYNKYSVLNKKEVDDNPEMYRDIMSLLRPITIVKSCINVEQLKKDAGVPEDWNLISRSYMNNEATYTWGTFDNHIKATVNDDNSDKYVYEEKVPSYICRCTEVYYMRKHYETQDAMYDLYDGDIQNCGFHHMSEVMIHDLNDLEGKKVLDENATNLYYHEWY